MACFCRTNNRQKAVCNSSDSGAEAGALSRQMPAAGLLVFIVSQLGLEGWTRSAPASIKASKTLERLQDVARTPPLTWLFSISTGQFGSALISHGTSSLAFRAEYRHVKKAVG